MPATPPSASRGAGPFAEGGHGLAPRVLERRAFRRGRARARSSRTGVRVVADPHPPSTKIPAPRATAGTGRGARARYACPLVKRIVHPLRRAARRKSRRRGRPLGRGGGRGLATLASSSSGLSTPLVAKCPAGGAEARRVCLRSREAPRLIRGCGRAAPRSSSIFPTPLVAKCPAGGAEAFAEARRVCLRSREAPRASRVSARRSGWHPPTPTQPP
jgi:hypothetical protein